ncbi:MAG: energy-coupling factor ABC transporter ATP-binding protein [Sphaerochaetaceae bacterium]|nr:energy-coupling factor ABC transporter ATP-binding protein [Sphaerochaetaceae bacterium]
MSCIFRAEDLVFKADNREILSGISFAVDRGQLMAVCGPNGAGKSCLLRILKGLSRPHSGKIFFSEQDCTKNEKLRLSKTGLVFQDADVQTIGETVEKDIAFGPRNLKMGKDEIKRAVDDAISFFDLEKFRKQGPETLSGGERRKLVIAGVIAMDPEVIMLDEPFANLDYRGVQMVLRAILKLKESGRTIILVSHEVEKFLGLCDRVLIINDGKSVFEGEPEEAKRHFKENGIHCSDLPLDKLNWLEEE